RSAQAGFEQVDRAQVEVARTLGRSEWAIALTVSLPLAWRGILAGVALAFARAMGEFGATVMVAGSVAGRTRTGSIAIYEAVQAGRMSEANVLAVLLTLVAAGVLLLLSRIGGRSRWGGCPSTSGRGSVTSAWTSASGRRPGSPRSSGPRAPARRSCSGTWRGSSGRGKGG